MTAIEIELSKKKTILLLLGALAFVAVGILFVIKPEEFVTPITRNRTLTIALGLLGILFFGGCFIYGVIKLFDKRAGLVIDESGITDNSNATSVGLIAWEDILSIETQQVASTKFLLIIVKNPEVYLERAKGIKRRLLKANMRYYGTPLSITSTSLNYDFDDLEKLVKSGLEKFNQPRS
jgi:hypothetical protein